VRKQAFAFVIVPLLLAAGCTSLAPDDTAASLDAAYVAAVADAAVTSPEKVARDLIAITPNQPGLVWQGAPGTSRVLVSTWASWAGYRDNVGKEMTLAQEVWVTTVPEVKRLCAGYGLPLSKLTLRLEQLLGLPRKSQKIFFVEMWADPDEMFRPTPNPDITNHESALDFPRSKNFMRVDPAYVTWFEDKKSSSYGANGYPWTRLGYTYDWGNPSSKRGASEFVVRKSAVVGVVSTTDTEQYCRP
jgi:hypothetical protein